MRLRRPPLWASFFALIGVCVLCALGTWQVHRLSWKEDLLMRIAAEGRKPLSVLDLGAVSEDFLFLPGTLEGRFVTDKFLFLGPRTLDGRVGAHLLMPFYVPDQDDYILVNRGWVEDSKRAYVLSSFDPVDDEVLRGVLRPPLQDNAFVPQNHPERGLWYRMDMSEIAAYFDVPLKRNAVFYLSPRVDAGEDGDLVPVGGPPQLPNNHFQYALFWFSMAGVLVGVFFFRFVRG